VEASGPHLIAIGQKRGTKVQLELIVSAGSRHHDGLCGRFGLSGPEVEGGFRCDAVIVTKTFLQIEGEKRPVVPMPERRISGINTWARGGTSPS